MGGHEDSLAVRATRCGVHRVRAFQRDPGHFSDQRQGVTEPS